MRLDPAPLPPPARAVCRHDDISTLAALKSCSTLEEVSPKICIPTSCLMGDHMQTVVILARHSCSILRQLRLPSGKIGIGFETLIEDKAAAAFTAGVLRYLVKIHDPIDAKGMFGHGLQSFKRIIKAEPKSLECGVFLSKEDARQCPCIANVSSLTVRPDARNRE